jgi:hypothetical protein
MKKYLFIVIILFVACNPQKRIIKNINETCSFCDTYCPKKNYDSIIVKTDTVTKYITQQIKIKLPADSSIIDAFVQCDSNYRATLNILTAKNQRLSYKLSIVNGRLTGLIKCNADSITTELKKAQIVIKELSNRKSVITNTIKVKNPINMILLLAFGISWLFIVALIYLIYKIIYKK